MGAILAHANAAGIGSSKMRIPDAYAIDIRHQAEHVQQPNDHEDYHDAIQYGFDRTLHGDQIDEPQKNPHYQ
jgi:hypothetical protein